MQQGYHHIREALKILEGIGLVGMKKGSNGGPFVSGFNAVSISEHLYKILRLAHVSINHLTQFRLAIGSVAAGTATMATLALPEMKKYGYGQSLATGSIVAGGCIMDGLAFMILTLAIFSTHNKNTGVRPSMVRNRNNHADKYGSHYPSCRHGGLYC